ncbi:MAG: M48 family metallopeptidase [Alistipes sp.]|nr:M48 family metallopeptidase [Alistipes sp.]
MRTKRLINLPPEEYEHPFDRAALDKLRAMPGLDTLTNFMLNWAYVKWHLVELKGSDFHVTRESCPELYELVRDVADTLNVDDFPEIYTEWGYAINAYTTGFKEQTLLVLNSGAVDLLNDTQLKYIVGHEMGHIKSGHVLYHMMAQLFSTMIGMVPLGETLLTPIQYALLYWNRMSEFTADRAGLLACQDKDEAIKSIIKMAGVPMKYFDRLDEKSFIKQAEEFEKLNSGIADSAIRTISIMASTHPWTVYRAGELLKWIASGEYDRILNKYEGVPCIHCGNILSKDSDYCHIHGGHPFE